MATIADREIGSDQNRSSIVGLKMLLASKFGPKFHRSNRQKNGRFSVPDNLTTTNGSQPLASFIFVHPLEISLAHLNFNIMIGKSESCYCCGHSLFSSSHHNPLQDEECLLSSSRTICLEQALCVR